MGVEPTRVFSSDNLAGCSNTIIGLHLLVAIIGIEPIYPNLWDLVVHLEQLPLTLFNNGMP